MNGIPRCKRSVPVSGTNLGHLRIHQIRSWADLVSRMNQQIRAGAQSHLPKRMEDTKSQVEFEQHLLVRAIWVSGKADTGRA